MLLLKALLMRARLQLYFIRLVVTDFLFGKYEKKLYHPLTKWMVFAEPNGSIIEYRHVKYRLGRRALIWFSPIKEGLEMRNGYISHFTDIHDYVRMLTIVQQAYKEFQTTFAKMMGGTLSA